MKLTKEKVIEALKPYMYPYMGSDFMTDTQTQSLIDSNAEKCLKIAQEYADQARKDELVQIELIIDSGLINTLSEYVQEKINYLNNK